MILADYKQKMMLPTRRYYFLRISYKNCTPWLVRKVTKPQNSRVGTCRLVKSQSRISMGNIENLGLKVRLYVGNPKIILGSKW
jgi:hypothetical protein